jgi:hypothetical protein
VFRNALPELFEVFDFADPSVVTGGRNVSTTAQQALFLMNDPFVVDQARHAARRMLGGDESNEHDRITQAYRLTLGRLPTLAEHRIATRFLRNQEGSSEEAWAILYQALFASMEFRYVN